MFYGCNRLESSEETPPRLVGVFPPPTTQEEPSSLNTILTFSVSLTHHRARQQSWHPSHNLSGDIPMCHISLFSRFPWWRITGVWAAPLVLLQRYSSSTPSSQTSPSSVYQLSSEK